MRKYAVLLIFPLALLGACSHNLYLQSRTTGVTGSAKVTTNTGEGNKIVIALGGKVYTGQWVYAAMGGTVSMGSATAFSGTQAATAYGTAIGMPTSGNGSILASAPDGSSLHCMFDYSEWSSAGTGACQDNRGEVYDLQIH